jgi:hypothetical protein
MENDRSLFCKSVSLQGQLNPRFDAKAWLRFKMAQGNVNYFYFEIKL